MNHPLTTKADLRYYLACDRAALDKSAAKPNRRFGERIWRFEVLLRHTEFWYAKRQQSLWAKLHYFYYKWHFNRQSIRYGLEIPLNVIGEGLVIWHLQKIIINENATIGKNLSLSAGVIIGQAHDVIPEIGDNVELTVDSKVLGAKVCDHVTVGAGAVVVKDITEPHTVWAGVPAKRISNKYPAANLAREKRVAAVKA